MTRRILAIVLPLAVAGLLAGCGGGGGGEASADSQASLPSPDAASAFVNQGVSAGQSAAQAVQALGSPGPVDATRAGETVGGYDDFGTPKDVFVQQVTDGTGTPGTNGAETAPGAIPGVPTVSPPYGTPTNTPVPPGTAPTTPGTPTTPATGVPGVPTTTPNSLEADFDISGEPVVAREGDAIPPDTQQFTVKAIGSKTVTLLLNAGLLPDGKDTVTLGEGDSITLFNQTAQQKYKIKLVDIRSVG
jgi:hypothetical protein